MKKRITYLFFIMIVVSMGLLYGFSSVKNSTKTVAETSIEFKEGSNDFLTQKMVNKLLIQNGEEVKNQAKSVIDLQGLEHSVRSNPYIENAKVYLTIDGVLKTVVKQRTPIARINTEKTSYYIDKQGVEVPLSSNYSARVLLVTGAVEKKDLKQITAFVNVILSDDFLKKEIIGIHKKQQDAFVLSVRSGNYKIELGNLKRLSAKLTKLKAFYNKTFEDKTIQQYKTINLKYHNQVVCAK